MSLAIIQSRASIGIHAPLVTVEAHLSNGLPHFSIVGLPETAVKESKDRVRSALLNTHFEFPIRRITINLAPADLPKEGGGRFDLPIALSILAASGQIPTHGLANYEFAGELALSGMLRPIHGILPFSIATAQAGRHLIIPTANADEAALPSAAHILPAQHLLDVCAHLTGNKLLTKYQITAPPSVASCANDFSEVKGQQHAKRALEIAAAGGHSLLMIGPPGTGKTMLASRLPSILPTLTEQEILEVAAIASLTLKKTSTSHWSFRPFRAPHHTASSVALVGGGNPPRPGEISLAHQGILFLDELPEFSRHVLETLREPLESGTITISRANQQVEFPAKFQLIAAMNPCPCGYLGDKTGRCHCTPSQIQRYHAKLSGPLLDRIDMHIEVSALPSEILIQHTASSIENSAQIRMRVERARQQQLTRLGKINHALTGQELEEIASLITSDAQLLEKAITQLGLSGRTYHRILRVARTIADLEENSAIQTSHLTEALSYRRLMKNK